MGDSLWRWTPDYDRVGPGVMAGGDLPALAWAEEIRPELLQLQIATGLPALGVVAQLIHEAFNPGGWELSRLAADYHNYGGLKWAEWQADFGARPVSMSTWEEIDGTRVDLDDAFGAFPSRATFIRAYAHLMTFNRYRPALQFSTQPLLWLHQVWAAGYATDSRYLAGLGRWMAAVWPIYAGTTPTDLPMLRPVEVVDPTGRQLAAGWLMDPDGPGPEGDRTVVRARPLAEALGLTATYEDRDPVPRLTLAWPGLQ